MIVRGFLFAQNSPIDFETGGYGAAWTWTVFENGDNPSLEIVTNPNTSGINSSATVAKFTALQAGQPHAGCESLHGSDIGTFSLDATNSTLKIMVYKTVISDVGLKFVIPTSGSLGEIKVANTVTNAWEELTFDFSSHIGLTEAIGIDQIVVFPDFNLGGRTQDNIIYFDNISFYSNSVGVDNRNETFLQGFALEQNFPNPFNPVTTLRYDLPENGHVNIAIYDMLGKQVKTLINQTQDAGCGDGTSKDLECDGKGNRSRQELSFDIKKKLNNKEHIYEYAIYFDKSYESLEKRAVVILGQHHTQKYNVKGCHSCCNFWLADTIYKGEHKYTWQSKSASNVDPVVIGKIEDLKGKWTHIKLHVLWKKDGTGRFIIYKNKEVIADLKGIKTLADTCNSGYLKLGIYRHNTIGYWNSDWESLPDQTVYYDNIVFRKPKKDEKIKNK